MPCLICRYFQPTEPPQHKLDREAGRCESRCGDKWDHHTAINYIKRHGGAIDGWCRLHPEPKHVKNHGHFCGDISVYDYFFAGWGVEQFKEGVSLFAWAQQALTTVLHGRDDWRSQRLNQLEEQTKELKRQLQQARKISASRFKRLQKTEKKPEPKLEPFVPRLVAAE